MRNEQYQHSDSNRADACFEAMVRHSKIRRAALPIPSDPPNVAPQYDIEDIDLAWGAKEIAIVIFGPPSRNRAEDRRRRRRVFCMWAEYKKALLDAKKNNRPPPVNMMGWVSLPDTNRLALHKPRYRAFIAAQLGEDQ